MEAEAATVDRVFTTMGLRIKRARMLRCLTLKELAARAEWSESMLSKVERGLASPSLTALHKLAVVLDTNVGELTSAQAPIDAPVMKAGGRTQVTFGGGIVLERLVVPGPGLLLQADIHVVPPRESGGQQISHVGEEFGYLLSGSIELRIGDEVHVLEPHDSFHFRSELPHSYRNLGETEARIVWINTPPTF